MAKYTINYQCGHTEVIQFFGPHADRVRKIAYLETCYCPHCINAEILASTDLVGSDKQILWANKIRQEFKALIADMSRRCNDEGRQMLKTSSGGLLQDKKTAAWWIEHRNDITSQRTMIDILRAYL